MRASCGSATKEFIALFSHGAARSRSHCQGSRSQCSGFDVAQRAHVLALVALVCASPFDALAESARVALAEDAPPGLMSAEHLPSKGWRATLHVPFGTIATCVPGPAATMQCTRAESHEAIESQPVARFFARIVPPPDVSVTILIEQQPELYARLSMRNRERVEDRLLLVRDTLVMTEPLQAVTSSDDQRMFAAIESLQWPFLVLEFSEGGMGDNASGSVAYRLVQLIEGERVGFGSVLELGGGVWGRAVTDTGFMHGSRVDLVCPVIKPPFITTRRVCEGDVDPRTFGSMKQLCAQPKPCRRPRDKASPRAGVWSIGPRSLRPLAGLPLTTPGAVQISELPDWRARSLEAVELTNHSDVAQDLTNTMLMLESSQSGWLLESCVLGPREVVVVSRDRARTSCGVQAEEELAVPTDEALVLRRWSARGLGPPIARTRVPSSDVVRLKVDVEAEEVSWQRDSAGHTCSAPPSLGRANAKCR